MEVYTKSQHESCFLASRLLYLIVVSPPDRRYKIAVVCDDGFTGVTVSSVIDTQGWWKKKYFFFQK